MASVEVLASKAEARANIHLSVSCQIMTVLFTTVDELVKPTELSIPEVYDHLSRRDMLRDRTILVLPMFHRCTGGRFND